MILEGEFISETIFGGFISKVVNNVWNVSWEAIKKADNNRADKKQSFQARIYQIIIDILNLMTQNQYKGKDIIYDTAEKLLKEFKSSSNYNDTIKYGMKNLFSNFDDSIYQEFIRLLCHELGEEKNFDLYKEILLLLVNEKNNHTNEELQLIQHKLDYVIQKLNDNEQVIKIEEESHLIQSRTQEYADKWNENMFLNDFSEWDENVGVNVKLKDVYIDEHLPHFIWNRNRNVSSNLKKLLIEYIEKNNTKKMLLILGQPGIGKSTLITWIIEHLKNNNNYILVYQFVSDFKNINWWNKNNGNTSDIVDEILNNIGLSYNNLDGKTLIIDGFDEINVGNNRADILNHFYWKMIKSGRLNKFSLIITCRENCIRNLYQVECDYIELQPWDEEQIKSFCEIFQVKTKSNVYEYTIENIIENKEILGIPLILYMILSLNISIKRNESIFDVYEKIFSLHGGIYDRCINNVRFELPHRVGTIKEQIHLISEEMAFWMFENNFEEATISIDEYENISKDVISKNDYKNGEIKQDILIGNYFKHCEGTEKVCFIHRSIFEYFVIEYIFESIRKIIKKPKEKIACVFANLFKSKCISKVMINFLEVKIRNSGLKNAFLIVNNVFEEMINNGMTYYLDKHCHNVIKCEMNIFVNMLELLHVWKKGYYKYSNSICHYLSLNSEFKFNFNLCRFDLRSVNLRGKHLAYTNFINAILMNACVNDADLVGSDLRHANMEKTHLVNTHLANADLSDAILKSAYLRNANLNGANLCRADLSGAYLNKTNLIGANILSAVFDNSNLDEAIIDEYQITILEKICDLSKVRIYREKTKDIISYNDYKNK